MSDVERRVAALESAFAFDGRLKSVESEVKKLKSSTCRDWVQTLGPWFSGLIVLVVGFVLKDSVTLALQRQQLDLEYAKQMRDLIEDFDKAQSQSSADTNAVALGMFGKYAVIPLVERLEGGDVASLAAEKGLRFIGSNDPQLACPKFAQVLTDQGRRFRWQTHKTIIKVTGESGCSDTRGVLESYDRELADASTDSTKLSAFAQRFSEPESFDADSASNMRTELDRALEILNTQVHQ